MARIAFIGLGKMGRPIAATLAWAGYRVRGFDLVDSLRVNAERDGISAAPSAKERL
jgi:3-hydroxyisobutyrate dehydrogenase